MTQELSVLKADNFISLASIQCKMKHLNFFIVTIEYKKYVTPRICSLCVYYRSITITNTKLDVSQPTMKMKQATQYFPKGYTVMKTLPLPLMEKFSYTSKWC